MCAYQIPIGLGRLASAEVAERPSGIPEHAELVVLAKEVQQGTQSSLLQDVIAALRAVSSNVTERPDSLLAHVGDGGREELDKLWNGLRVDDNLGVLGRSGGDVGQSPRGLELKVALRNTFPIMTSIEAYLKHGIVSAQEFNKAGHHPALNDAFDRRVLFF